MKHLFMLTTIHDFKLYSLILQFKSKIKCILWLWKLKNLKMFISEFEKDESIWNVWNIQKLWCVKSKFQKISWIIWDDWQLIRDFLYDILLVSRDSIALILKENKFHICALTTSTRGVFRTQPNIYGRLLLQG